MSRTTADLSGAAHAIAPTASAERQTDGVAWISSLRSSGPQREQAAARLHRLLLGAARFELLRRGSAWQGRGESLDDLATQSADSALAALLGKLDDYRFESRFSTWAYKFAILEAASLARRRAWQERELPTDPQAWGRIAQLTGDLAHDLSVREQLHAVTDAIQTELSVHQREVLTALVLEGVPIDVLAERLSTTRGALYKALHDARRKLRAAVEPGTDG